MTTRIVEPRNTRSAQKARAASTAAGGSGASEPYPAEARRETAEDKARRIVQEELAALSWDRAALTHHPKGDARKVGVARRVRAETSVTLKWMAEHLQMGTWTRVANLLAHNPAPSDNQPDLNLC